MLKEELTILIVDDDLTFGKALSEAVAQAGYKPLYFSKPDDALNAAKVQSLHFAIVDCMLPKMNGRDLILKIKKELFPDLPILLISGIFKDKGYIRDAQQSTGAIGFLTKPFSVQDAIQWIDKSLSNMIDSPKIPIYDLLSKPNPSAKERIRSINNSDQVQGYDLPLLYSFLLDQKVNGHLNIVNSDGDVAGVGFSKGSIIQVNTKDQKSYFGVLLVEKGFISHQELEKVLAKGKTRRMGEQLVEANVLSPHAVQIVIAEQQAIRLSKTISNNSCKINFIESTDITEDAQTDKNAFTELIDDWTFSKIPLEWIKSFYLPWMNYSLRKGPEYSDSHPCLYMHCLGRFPGMHKKLLKEDTTLEQLVMQYEREEEAFFRGFHVMILCRLITFGESKQIVNYDSNRARLIKLEREMQKQNYFERLGLSNKARDAEIKRAFHELAKVLHPDKLPPDSPSDLKDLTRSIFLQLTQAYETLSNPTSRETYIKEMEQGRAELVLQAETKMEQGKALLRKGDVKKAQELLEEAMKLSPPTSELRLIMMWARLKAKAQNGDLNFASEIKNQLSQIPPEDRHNATYYLVKGLLMKYMEDYDGAQKCFENAQAMDTEFLDARREINLLKLQNQNSKTDLLRGDLKDVVGALFKKLK